VGVARIKQFLRGVQVGPALLQNLQRAFLNLVLAELFRRFGVGPVRRKLLQVNLGAGLDAELPDEFLFDHRVCFGCDRFRLDSRTVKKSRIPLSAQFAPVGFPAPKLQVRGGRSGVLGDVVQGRTTVFSIWADVAC